METTTAVNVQAGDILVSRTISGEDYRQRIHATERLTTWVQTREGRQEFDTVRLHHGGSSDYAPDSTVRIIRTA